MSSEFKKCKWCKDIDIPKGTGQTYCGYKCDGEAKKDRKRKRRALRPKSPVTNRAYPLRNDIIKALVDEAKAQIKERDNWTCQWCDKQKEGKGCQGSHVIPMSSCGQNALAWDLMNIKVLCAYCHKKWHSDPLNSVKWFDGKFPERRVYLDNYQQTKISDQDLRTLYDKLKQRQKSEVW